MGFKVNKNIHLNHLNVMLGDFLVLPRTPFDSADR